MTLAGAVTVAAVVWVVSLIRSVRLRALAYSLPLPMTVALATSGARVDGGQLAGVALLVGFFAVVAYLHERLGWHIALADAAGVAGYLAAGAVVASAGDIPFAPALAVVCALWLAVRLAPRLAPPPPGGPTPGGPAGAGVAANGPALRGPARDVRALAGTLARLGSVFASALVVVWLAGALRGLVVTFPYSGVLVAVEARRHLGEFTRHFARASLALVAFLTGCRLAQGAGLPASLAAGWLAFAVTAAGLHGTRAATARHRDGT